MPGSPTAAVEVHDLVIDRGRVRAVDGISFSAHAAEITVVLGPNGAGKTTTVEHLEGYVPRSSGTSSVLGLDPEADHHRLSSAVGIMLQEGGIPTAIRPRELLGQYASFHPDPLDPAELLEQVGLSGRSGTAFRKLSGGEKQRLSLALCLIGRPRLVFLDEPTAGVDLEGRDLIRSLVRSLATEGTTVVLTTHDLAEAEQLADRIVILDHGRVVADGSPAALMAGTGEDDVRFSAAPGIDVAAMGQEVGGRVVELSPGEYRVELAPSPGVVAAITGWLAAHDVPLGQLRAGRANLEDVFRRLTAEPGSDS